LHDISFFEKAGLPAVALLSNAFKPQAQYQAKSLGLSDAARVFVQHPISDQNTASIHQKADAVFPLVEERLLSTEGWTQEKDDGSSTDLPGPDCST